MSRDRPPLDGLDLNLLVTLRALLREESVTRAAARLGQTQPTVSRALATLRTTFSDPLLVRSGRGMALTPLATSLQTPLERSLGALDRLRTVGDFDPAQDARTFRLMTPDILGMLLVPALLARVRQQAPAMTFQILGSERDALRRLLHDEVDLVVAAPAIMHPELSTRRVRGVEMDWQVVFGAHRAVWDDGIDLEGWLASAHLQLIPAGRPDVPSVLDDVLQRIGHTRRVVCQISDIASVADTLRQTDCVVSLPTPMARRLADGDGLKRAPHPLNDQLSPIPLRMTWHHARQPDPGHAWLRDLLDDVIGTVFSAS
ncbi:MAG: LysR family transcriptional regulator [Myxococcota bacterium]